MICEEYPCCGHAWGDCDPYEYDVYKDPHLYCDHDTGHCDIEEYEDE